MKKGIFIILACFISATFVYAGNYEPLDEDGYYQVTKVIDGETYEVKDMVDNTYHRVQLIGVDTQGYNDAYKYMNNLVLGDFVYLRTSDNIAPDGRYDLVYMSYNNRVINDDLVTLGYAVADHTNISDDVYDTYANLENDAQYNEVGMWEYDDYSEIEEYYSESININTATSYELDEYLNYINSEFASHIKEYRKSNPFNTVEEIKFVPGFSASLYKDNVGYMHVATNITQASEKEINTLDEIEEYDAEDIVEYRDDNSPIDWEDLYHDDIISTSEYNANKDFVFTSDEDYISLIRLDDSVNINTASEKQINHVGFASEDAADIYDARDNYSFKTKEEILNIDELDYDEEDFNRIEDNFNVMTNINLCSVYELQSLFGEDYDRDIIDDIEDARPFNDMYEVEDVLSSTDFNDIKDYIYIDDDGEEYETDYVNINTATKEQIIDLGISSNRADDIQDEGGIELYEDMPTNLESYDREITLYTNINKASKDELLTLSDSMTTTIADEIISYSDKYTFASDDELEEFFEDMGRENIYKEIYKYVVYR